jgi:hypothetical protein
MPNKPNEGEPSGPNERPRLGKIVDVEDEAEHKTIEVWVE